MQRQFSGSNHNNPGVSNNYSGSNMIQQQQQQPQGQGANMMSNNLSQELIAQLVQELTIPGAKEQALQELNKNREFVPDLAPILWYSFGTMTSLLQEVISIYPLLSPPTLTGLASNRVCNALALLQCVASHPDTRNSFLKAHIPFLLYPFLNTTSADLPFQYLRLRSLGVIGALVKADDPEVISFLLSTEIIPLSLRIMEMGAALSKTVATFIVQKILLDDEGLNYICQSYERFLAVATVLGVMVQGLLENQSARLLKHVIRCYLRLCDNPRAREALRRCLPEPLKHPSFANLLKDDATAKKWLKQLLDNFVDQPNQNRIQNPNSNPASITNNNDNNNNVNTNPN